MAAMRPLIAAEPMLRAPRPEMVSESTLTGLFDWTTGADSPAVGVAPGSAPGVAAGFRRPASGPGRLQPAPTLAVSDASGAAGASVALGPGTTKPASARATLASVLVSFRTRRFTVPV